MGEDVHRACEWGVVYSPVQDSSLDRGETVFRRYGHFCWSCRTMQLCNIGLNFKINTNEEKNIYFCYYDVKYLMKFLWLLNASVGRVISRRFLRIKQHFSKGSACDARVHFKGQNTNHIFLVILNLQSSDWDVEIMECFDFSIVKLYFYICNNITRTEVARR